MDDPELPQDSKLTRSKQQWAEQGKFLTGMHSRPEAQRLPPGQHLTAKWPVLDLGRQPDIALDRWRLEVTGMVARPLTLDWAALMALPQTRLTSDIHCVTSWSRYDNDWQGVLTRDLLAHVEPRDEARAVMLHGYDGYTTNLLLSDFAVPDALIAATALREGMPVLTQDVGFLAFDGLDVVLV